MKKIWNHWSMKPVRALYLAYWHVFTGNKVQKPYRWSDI